MRRRAPTRRSGVLSAVLPAAALAFGCGESVEERTPLAAATAEQPDNRAPRIEALAFEPEAPRPGEAVRVRVEASDPDGDPVVTTYDWTLEGRPVGSGTSKLVLRGAARGERLEVRVVASDGRGESRPAVASVRLVNRPPRVTRLLVGPALEVSAGTPLEVEPVAEDEDGDALRFRHVWSVNGEESEVSGPVFATDALGRGDVVTVEVHAHDGSEEGEPLASPPIRVVNRPPRVVSRPGPSDPALGFRYRVEAVDADGDAPLRFELADAPHGMRIDAESGEITWKPRPEQTGVHPVRVLVDDLHGGRVAHAFEVKVGRAFAASGG